MLETSTEPHFRSLGMMHAAMQFTMSDFIEMWSNNSEFI